MSTAELNKTVSELMEYRRIADEAKKQAEALEALVKEHMTEAGLEEITLTECKITYKPVTSTRIDSKRLKADFPDVYDAYGVTSTSMRFNLTA